MGAALSQVSGTEDTVCSIQTQSRQQVIQQVKESAKQAAIKAGADPTTVEVHTFLQRKQYCRDSLRGRSCYSYTQVLFILADKGRHGSTLSISPW